ncbi:MAG: hypothetical protein AB1Z98_10855 [Nannocystaceae bacterium]
MFSTCTPPWVALAALLLPLAACNPATNDGLSSEPTELRPASEQGLIELLGDYHLSTEEVLDLECGLRSNAARNIDRFRRGPDERYGTDDDRIIDSERTLDSIEQVGPTTIEQLYACAEELGYIDDDCDLAEGEHEHEHDGEPEC